MKEKEINGKWTQLPISDSPFSIFIPNNIVSIETVEKAAFDIIQAYMGMEEQKDPNNPFKLHESQALVTVVATQIVNRIKQLAKRKNLTEIKK